MHGLVICCLLQHLRFMNSLKARTVVRVQHTSIEFLSVSKSIRVCFQSRLLCNCFLLNFGTFKQCLRDVCQCCHLWVKVYIICFCYAELACCMDRGKFSAPVHNLPRNFRFISIVFQAPDILAQRSLVNISVVE